MTDERRQNGGDYKGPERRSDPARRKFWKSLSEKMDEGVAAAGETGQAASRLWAAAVVLIAAIGFGAMGMQTYVTVRSLPAAVNANTATIRAEAERAAAERAHIETSHTARMNVTDSLIREVVETQEYLVCRDDPSMSERECASVIFR